MEMVSSELIEVEALTKDYAMGNVVVHALRGVSLTVDKGEFVAIKGASGSGKSTFMNMIGCLDRPSAGTYRLDDVDVSTLDRDERATIRNHKIGFVFQGFNLLARETARDNVELPLIYAGVPARERAKRAAAALEIVGLTPRVHHLPHQLSGGQQQRVAIARALVGDPPLLLADEPTGNLDSETSEEIMAILMRLNAERGITIVLVTHEPDIAAFAKRVIVFRDGRVESDTMRAPQAPASGPSA
jgi:putative ABC transport system ATP-binding protein